MTSAAEGGFEMLTVADKRGGGRGGGGGGGGGEGV